MVNCNGYIFFDRWLDPLTLLKKENSEPKFTKETCSRELYIFLSIISGVLSVGILHLSYYLINKIDNYFNETTRKTQSAFSNVQSQKNLTPQIFGGFERVAGKEGNTCFLATALQVIRQIPRIRELLKVDKKVKHEASAKFKARQELKNKIAHMLDVTDTGRKITGNETHQLHKMLYNYNETYCNRIFYIPAPGEMGDVTHVIRLVTKMLKISFHYCHKRDESPPTPGIIDIDTDPNQYASFDLFTVIYGYHNHRGINLKNEPETVFNHTTPDGSQCSYALVAAGSGGTHSVTYVKEVGQSKGWIYCNDDVTKRVDRIPENTKLAFFYYKKIEA